MSIDMDEAGHPALRVLVVEDHPEDAELMVRELRRGYSDLTWSRVANGPEFIAALESAPDIILSDYTVPGFGALRALDILRERAPDIPLLVITGSLEDVAAAECIRLGAEDYLLKDRDRKSTRLNSSH